MFAYFYGNNKSIIDLREKDLDECKSEKGDINIFKNVKVSLRR